MQRWRKNRRMIKNVLCNDCPCDNRLGVCYPLLFEPYYDFPVFPGCPNINKTYHPTIYTFEPFSVDTEIIVCNQNLLVDDDLEINGQIIAEGVFPYFCPENQRHTFTIGTVLAEIPQDTEIIIKVIDWYGPPCEGYGGIKFVEK